MSISISASSESLWTSAASSTSESSSLEVPFRAIDEGVIFAGTDEKVIPITVMPATPPIKKWEIVAMTISGFCAISGVTLFGLSLASAGTDYGQKYFFLIAAASPTIVGCIGIGLCCHHHLSRRSSLQR